MKVYPWWYSTEQGSYLASEAQGAQLAGGCQGDLLDAEWMLHAGMPEHTRTQSLPGLAAITNRGKLAWNVFILIKGFHTVPHFSFYHIITQTLLLIHLIQ